MKVQEEKFMVTMPLDREEGELVTLASTAPPILLLPSAEKAEFPLNLQLLNVAALTVTLLPALPVAVKII